jgi:hypothetical protein
MLQEKKLYVYRASSILAAEGVSLQTHVMYLSTKHIILEVNEEEARQLASAEPKAQEENRKADEEKVDQVAEEGWPKDPERRKPSNFRQESPPLIFPPRMRAKLPGGYLVDVPFEASKLPLDVAVFNSTRGLKSAEQRWASATGDPNSDLTPAPVRDT